MLSFIKKLFGLESKPVAEAPYKVEAPVEAPATVSAEAVVIVPDAVAPAMTPIPLVVEAAPKAKKPRAKKPAAPKAAKPKAPKTPKAK